MSRGCCDWLALLLIKMTILCRNGTARIQVMVEVLVRKGRRFIIIQNDWTRFVEM